MHPNRNDEPDQMAATRASGEGSETELVSTKIYQKKKEAGGSGGGSPPRRGRAPEARPLGPLSKLQDSPLFRHLPSVILLQWADGNSPLVKIYT